MNPFFKTLMLVAAVAGLFVSATARADWRDYNDKAWNVHGRASSGTFMRSRPQVRATAPAEQRSYSYEPSSQAVSGRCGGSVGTEQTPATAQRPAETRRSFSYEPSIGDTGAARGMSSRAARKPAYLLPKTDPNRYRGF